jgi:hypothetical protein
VKTTSIPMRLWILSLCASTSVNKFSCAVAREMVVVISSNQVYPCIFYLSLSMDNIMSINQFAAPMGAQLEPPKSSKPILIPDFELRSSLISMVQDQSFLGEGDDNPYTHLREFGQTCACLHIVGMSHETLK